MIFDKWKIPKTIEVVKNEEKFGILKRGNYSIEIGYEIRLKYDSQEEYKNYSSKIFNKKGECIDTHHDCDYYSESSKRILNKFSIYKDLDSDDPSMIELLKQTYGSTFDVKYLRGNSGTIRRHMYRDCVKAYFCTDVCCYFLIKTKQKYRGIEYVNAYGFKGFQEVDVERALEMINKFKDNAIHRLPSEDTKNGLVAEKI